MLRVVHVVTVGVPGIAQLPHHSTSVSIPVPDVGIRCVRAAPTDMSGGIHNMSTVEWKVAVGTETTTAVYEPGARTSNAVPIFVCAHGAGGSMTDRGMLATAKAFHDHGIGVVRFNFLYKEKGS